MRNFSEYLISLLAVMLFPVLLFGQLNVPSDIVSVTPKWSQTGTVRGESLKLALQVRISKGWHINSDRPLDEFLIPTKVDLQTPEGVAVGRIYYPTPELLDFDFSDNKVAVFQGTATLMTSVSVDQSFAGKSVGLQGTLTYQACNNTSCLPPQQVNFSTSLPVVAGPDQAQAVNAELFTGFGTTQNTGPDGGSAQNSQIATWLNDKGFLLTLLLIFVGGLALNLTPCVYPLIPITVSYFGGQAKGDSVKSTFSLAVFYVLGMAITYSLLGTIAALTGQMLGSALQNPIVLGFIALILVALAASMFGAFEIRIPQSLASVGGKSRQGMVGSLLMGLTVGIIAAPCIGPFVLSLLIFVGDLGNPWLGFLLFFVLSLGLGLPFLILGTFSGLIQKLPRSGQWMVWVRYIFGFILVGMAVYFLAPVMNAMLYKTLLALDAFAGAIFLGVFTLKRTDTRTFKIIKPVVGLLFLAIGLWVVIPAHAESEGIEWNTFSREALQTAAQSGTPVIIDFAADWCIPCKELDKFTFSDPAVRKAADDFQMLKADLTQNNAPDVLALKKEYDIRGVPTIVFLDANGQEIPELRVTGFEPPEKFIQRMEKVSS